MADLLTIAETAERLRVSARTVEREIAAGRLACVRVRSRRLVKGHELIRVGKGDNDKDWRGFPEGLT